jgi:hypothetical protein
MPCGHSCSAAKFIAGVGDPISSGRMAYIDVNFLRRMRGNYIFSLKLKWNNRVQLFAIRSCLFSRQPFDESRLSRQADTFEVEAIKNGTPRGLTNTMVPIGISERADDAVS